MYTKIVKQQTNSTSFTNNKNIKNYDSKERKEI